jgi:hypothetical protein
MRFLWDEQEQDYFSEEEIAEIKARRMERYAVKERNQQEDNREKHQGNGSFGSSEKASDRCGIE